MSRSNTPFLVALLFVAAVPGLADPFVQDGANAEKPDLAAIAEQVRPSLVRVQYSLKFDRGEQPTGAGWRYHCPNCGQYHYLDASGTIAEERPAELAGFLLSPTTVITTDPIMHPRFIEKIEVASHGAVVPARTSSYALEQNAWVLELAEPLEAARPLAFDGAGDGALFAVGYTEGDGQWTVQVSPVSGGIIIREDGEEVMSVPGGPLIVDSSGEAVGMTFTEELPRDDSWHGSPVDWPLIAALELDNLLLDTAERASNGIVRAMLRFRSPPQDEAMDMWSSDSSSETEWTGAGILIDDTTVLIPANLKPKLTARLERITVVQQDGSEAEAAFVGSLEEYGAILARTVDPLRGPLPLDAGDILDLHHDLLLSAEVRVQGETRTDFVQHSRIAAYSFGWRGMVYPEISTPYETPLFLFSREGSLVAFPLARRQKVSVEDEWGYDATIMTPAAHLHGILADATAHFDPNNVPLSEEEENRIAWFGVELQPLDAELARMNNVSDETGDGTTGAIVTYIYPNSPAASAGLELGDILLRMNIEGEPRPLEINVSSDFYSFMEQFPWDRYDELPEEYYDQIPHPWPAADSALHRKLTDVGFGTPFTLEYIRNAEKLTADFTVEQSPSHYDSARKYENEDMGLTVKELTYEVRRYFQRADDEPGVIASKVEPGSKASIAGVKPYEIITHVNDTPIHTADDFESAVAAGGELRLDVRRMTRGRIVKVQLSAPETGEEEVIDEIAPPDEVVDDEGGGG